MVTYWYVLLVFRTQLLNFSRIHTIRTLPYGGYPLPRERPPGQRTLDRDPLDRDPSWTETPGQRTPLDRNTLGQRPLWTETPHLDRHPTWTDTPPGQTPHLDRHPTLTENPRPVNRITDRCENITLPQLRCEICPILPKRVIF